MTTRIVFPIAVAAVCAISLALRVVYLDERSLWFDEASSWLTSQFPPYRLMESLKQSTHVPLYYPLLRTWMAIFGDSPTAIRSLSVVLGLLTVSGCGMLGRKLAFTLANDDPQWGQQQHWFGLFCAALCGFNAFQVLASVEARMYSLGTLLQVVSTLVTLHVADSPQKKSGWVLLVGVTVASLYTHHFLALTAGIQASWLLWVLMNQRCNSASGWASALRVAVITFHGGLTSGSSPKAASVIVALRNWILAVCVVAVLWMPGLYLWLIQLGRVHKDFWIQPMTFWSVPETCFDFFVAPPPGRRWDLHDVGLMAFIAVAFLMLRLLPRMRADVCLLWMLAVGPLLAIAIVSLRTPLWESRYFRFAHVALLICLALSIWTITQRSRLRAVLCVVALCVSLAGSVEFWDLRDISNRQAVRGAMQMINQSNENATPTTTVIVISPTDYIIARYYAKQLGWSDRQVRLWTGENRLPGAAVHLINREDWWIPDDGPGSNQPAWMLGSGQSAAKVFDALPPGERDYEFRSDTHLSEWTVRLAEIEKNWLPLNEAFGE